MKLRDRLLTECDAAETTVIECAQGLVDALMVLIIRHSADAAEAERHIAGICEAMKSRICAAYVEYHTMMAEAQRQTRQ